MEIMHRTGNDHTREQQIKILIIIISKVSPNNKYEKLAYTKIKRIDRFDKLKEMY